MIPLVMPSVSSKVKESHAILFAFNVVRVGKTREGGVYRDAVD